MIFTNEKPMIKRNLLPKRRGYSLLETLIAIGIASIVMTSALSVVATIHYGQKRLQFTQDFYAEGRYLMERMAQMVRNNTIDYDYFFIEYGPPDSGGGSCGSDFDTRQVPGSTTTNDQTNRAALGYESIFFWDTNGDGSQNRNLGGKMPDGSDDACAIAWDNSDPATGLSNLYLINAGRTIRTSISFVDSDDADSDPDDIVVRRQLTTDLDDDGRGDVWGPYDMDGDGVYEPADGDVGLAWDATSTRCEILYDADNNGAYEEYPVLGDTANQDFCEQAYDFTSILPPAVMVNNLTFRPAPNQDPFLAFRVDAAQVHPHVFMYLDIQLDNPSRYGFEVGEEPAISFQTAVGSRVFGNIRR